MADIEKHSFYVHFFEWEFNSIWSKEVDEDASCEGCSKLKGFTTPEYFDTINPNFQESLRGYDPTLINVLLTPTFY